MVVDDVDFFVENSVYFIALTAVIDYIREVYNIINIRKLIVLKLLHT